MKKSHQVTGHASKGGPHQLPLSLGTLASRCLQLAADCMKIIMALTYCIFSLFSLLGCSKYLIIYFQRKANGLECDRITELNINLFWMKNIQYFLHSFYMFLPGWCGWHMVPIRPLDGGCVSTTRKNDGSVRTQSFWSLQITGLCMLTDIFSLNYTTHTLFHDTPHAIGWLIKVTGKLKPSYRMVIIFCMYLE